ncbi:DoxX family protein [Robiginitalea sp. IMCC43444]|uniref:DoxX family protein n=1 Tax=Robiginitalea sp. IMCC43444 TaxID=3459121 RepID=UPI0040430625
MNLTPITLLQLFAALSFCYFGISCLVAEYMVVEFERYGLKNFRKINGVLQLLGSLFLFLGFFQAIFTVIGAFGLALLMLAGFIVRLKIKDGFIKSSPAFIFMVINLIIGINALQLSAF